MAVAELLTRDIGTEDWIRDGAGPDMTNFSAWNFLPDDSLRITFDPYQVAAYAVGHQEVIFTTEEIAGIVRDEYLPL